MAVMWQGSLIPWIDPNGDPYVGAVAEFFDANTSTPQTVYTDYALSTSAGESDRTANASGMFGALFLNPDPGSYRVKVTAEDDTVIWDIAAIDVPQSATFVPPDAGDTSIELLARTGDLKPHYGTDATSGWVRAAGRTIGSGSSGASERANADCEDLFVHLWTVDSTLSVSGGRGGSAASDWAANKTIALPDLRERVPAGLATMGNSDAGRVADSLVDGGETSSDLGATAGADDVALSIAELPAHTHGGTTGADGAHGHPTFVSTTNNGSSNTTGGLMLNSANTAVQPAHDSATPDADAGDQIGLSATHTHTIPSQGSGTAHNNMQPTMFALWLIKL